MKVRLLIIMVLALFLSACGARISLEGESVVVGITPPSGEELDLPLIVQQEDAPDDQPVDQPDDGILSNPFVIGLLVLLGVIVVVLLVRATDRRPTPEPRDQTPPTQDRPRDG